LIGRKGTIGAVHHANRPFWPIDTVYYVLPLAGDDQRFLHHLFDYLPLALLNAATGVPGLSRRDVYALRGAFPSLNEQIAIARILEAVDTALEKARGVVDRARECRRALMQELLPPWIGLRELTSSQKPTGIDEIVRADVVTAVCNGSTPSRLEGRYWRQGTIPWLPTGKVHDRIITAADEFVTETALRECSIRLLPRGTVLVGMIGQGRTRGMSAYLDIEACINQNFGAFTPKSAPKLRVLGKWLFYFLDFHCSRVREVGGGTNQGALNCHLLKRLRIPLPSLERQKEVAAILESVESLEKARSNELMLWCDLKESLMHDLLTGRARVRNETRAVVP
jgi:type I restriction enzyme S subunit